MLKTYNIYTNCCDLFYEDGTSQRIYYYNDSGKVLKRKKTHPITKNIIDKKAVIIGKLYDETIMVLHNQCTLDMAEIISHKNFSQGDTCRVDSKASKYDVYNLLHKALAEAVKSLPYAAIDNHMEDRAIDKPSN